jgi:hypothetical protein
MPNAPSTHDRLFLRRRTPGEKKERGTERERERERKGEQT